MEQTDNRCAEAQSDRYRGAQTSSLDKGTVTYRPTGPVPELDWPRYDHMGFRQRLNSFEGAQRRGTRSSLKFTSQGEILPSLRSSNFNQRPMVNSTLVVR